MKRIAILARDYPLQGGRMTFIKKLVSSKLMNNFNFKIITNQRKSLKDIVYQKNRFKKGVMRLLEYYFKSYKSLARLKKEQGIDLILGAGLSSLGGAIFSKIHRIPYVHNLSGFRLSEKPKRAEIKDDNTKKKRKSSFIKNIKSRFENALTILFEVSNCLLSNKITVPTELSKEKIIKRLPSKKSNIIITYEGINSDRIKRLKKETILKKLGLKKRNKIVLFARIEEREIYNKTLELLKRDAHDIKVLEIEARCINFIGDLRNMKRVKTKLNINEAFNIGDVLICLSVIEAHSSTAMEALSLGVPAIANNVDWFKYEFKKFPLLRIDNLSPDELLKKIKDFYKNKKRYINCAYDIKEKLFIKYNMDKCIKDHLGLFNKLINNV